MMTKNNKGFTLVELIIVITILAILATVAFIQFQSYSGDARDSKRLANLNDISKAIAVKNTTTSTKYIDMVDATATITSTTGSLAIQGYAGGAAIDTNSYKVGKLNFQMLALTNDDFKDALFVRDYVVAAVNTGSTSVYQLAAKLENAGVPKTLIVGTYSPRTITGSTSSGNVSGSKVTLTNNFGIFKKGDFIIGSGTTNSGSISELSSDTKILTTSGVLDSASTSVKLVYDESSSLIFNSGTLLTNGGTVFPY